jgi:hypothetical protein
MTIRDYLEQRERELQDELNLHYSQIAPKEAELAEVRRAKAAIGMSTDPMGGIGFNGLNGLGGFGLGSRLNLKGNLYNALMPPPPPNLSGLETLAALATARSIAQNDLCSGMTDPSERTPSRYALLTMKQLIVKVLAEHFTQGATAREMLDFFRDAWGRDIERQNLSPQLSRLYRDGIVGRGSDGIWFLVGLREPQEGDTQFLADQEEG